MTKLAAWILAFSLALTVNGFAQSPSAKRFAKIEANWLAWLKKNRIGEAQLAVAYEGEIVLSKAVNTNVEKRMKLASLSKAITGACFLELEGDDTFTRDTTIRELRAQGLLTNVADTSADDITLAQLLIHTSGLKPDITQGDMHNLFNKRKNRLEKYASESLEGRNIDGKAGDYFYNNGNYAVLGAVIEGKTDKTYEEACSEALKDLKGFDGIQPSKKLLAISAFGGWEGSAVNYLKFANAAFGKGTTIQRDRFSLPNTRINKGLYYGPGVLFRKNRRAGTNVWHFGALCFPDPADNAGSYFAIIGGGWSVTVIHDTCLRGKASLELDQTLMSAIFSKL